MNRKADIPQPWRTPQLRLHREMHVMGEGAAELTDNVGNFWRDPVVSYSILHF